MPTASEDTPNQRSTRGEDYRRYLERTGVTDTLIRLLVTLYELPEWPVNPTEFIYKKYSEICGIGENMKEDTSASKEKIRNLEQTISNLQNELKMYKANEEDHDSVNVTNL